MTDHPDQDLVDAIAEALQRAPKRRAEEPPMPPILEDDDEG